jgi:hypothetical protein
MVCQGCGAQFADDVHFCSRCGNPVTAAQPAYRTYPQQPMPALIPRVQQHIQALGTLWCLFGAYRIIGGLFGMLVLRVVTMRGFGSDWPFNHYHGQFGSPWMASFLPFIAIYTVVMAGLALFVGYSLLTRKPWGRTTAIVVGVLALLKPLLGTALGIYTLWVLAPSDSAAEYEAIADRS